MSSTEEEEEELISRESGEEESCSQGVQQTKEIQQSRKLGNIVSVLLLLFFGVMISFMVYSNLFDSQAFAFLNFSMQDEDVTTIDNLNQNQITNVMSDDTSMTNVGKHNKVHNDREWEQIAKQHLLSKQFMESLNLCDSVLLQQLSQLNTATVRQQTMVVSKLIQQTTNGENAITFDLSSYFNVGKRKQMILRKLLTKAAIHELQMRQSTKSKTKSLI